MKTAFSIFQNIVLVIACLVLLAGTVCLVFGFRPAIVMTGSMAPEISPGSLCVYNIKTAYEDITEGDIIVFKNADIRVTHRVSEITEKGFVTKGDANSVNDAGVVTEKYYLGETVLWIPELGRIAAFFKTVNGMILLGTIVLVMIIFSVVLKEQKDR